MDSDEAIKFLTDNGESVDWAVAAVSDAVFDGSSFLTKWDVTYDPESKFTVTPRPRRQEGQARSNTFETFFF